MFCWEPYRGFVPYENIRDWSRLETGYSAARSNYLFPECRLLCLSAADMQACQGNWSDFLPRDHSRTVHPAVFPAHPRELHFHFKRPSCYTVVAKAQPSKSQDALLTGYFLPWVSGFGGAGGLKPPLNKPPGTPPHTPRLCKARPPRHPVHAAGRRSKPSCRCLPHEGTARCATKPPPPHYPSRVEKEKSGVRQAPAPLPICPAPAPPES